MYKIVITKVEDVEKKEEGEWTTVDTRPYTKEETDKSSYPDEFKGKLKSIYGHTPDRTVTKEVEREVLKQTVASLDLVEVIKSINGIK